jgi:hypothetical protein
MTMVPNREAIRQLLAKGLSIKARINVIRYRPPIRIRAAMAIIRFLFIRMFFLSGSDFLCQGLPQFIQLL